MGQNCSTCCKNNQPIVGRTNQLQQDAIAWCNLGAMGGDSAGEMIVAGQQCTDQQCYIKALELDNKYASAWHNLGTVGGGSVGGQQYTQQQC